MQDCKSIITGVFNEYRKTVLLYEICVIFMCSFVYALNHKEIKLCPILVRYFGIKSGICLKILN